MQKKFKRLKIPDEILNQLSDPSLSVIERVNLAETMRAEYLYRQSDMTKLINIPSTTYCRCLQIIRSANADLYRRAALGYITIRQAVSQLDDHAHNCKNTLFENRYALLYISGDCCYLERKYAQKHTLIFNADCGKTIQHLLENGYTPDRKHLACAGKPAYNYKTIAVTTDYGCPLDTARFGCLKNTNDSPDDYRTDRLRGTGVIADYRLSHTKSTIYLFVPGQKNDGGAIPYVTGYSKRLWDLLNLCMWHIVANKYPAHTVGMRNLCLHSLVFIENFVPKDWSASEVLRFATECRQDRSRNIAHFDQNEHNNRISNLANMPQKSHQKMDAMIRQSAEKAHRMEDENE